MHLDCRYQELYNTCILSLVYIALNVRDRTESKYPSTVLLSILSKRAEISCRHLYPAGHSIGLPAKRHLNGGLTVVRNSILTGELQAYLAV